MSDLKEQIVLIEDDFALGEGLQFNFEVEGYEVKWFETGAPALKYIKDNSSSISAVIQDLMLPDMDGFEILAEVRSFDKKIPVLVLSARTLENDKVKALQLEADDYVTKPFSLLELVLRVKGLVKKRKIYEEKRNNNMIKFGDHIFVEQQGVLKTDDGELKKLSAIEIKLIKTFLNAENSVLTRGQLLEKVWGHANGMETRTVDVFVGRLRKLVEETPSTPKFLISIRGIGYIYVTDDELRKNYS